MTRFPPCVLARETFLQQVSPVVFLTAAATEAHKHTTLDPDSTSDHHTDAVCDGALTTLPLKCQLSLRTTE